MIQGWGYVREGHKLFIYCPQGRMAEKCVNIAATDEGVKSFMSSLTLDQLKTMFKGLYEFWI